MKADIRNESSGGASGKIDTERVTASRKLNRVIDIAAVTAVTIISLYYFVYLVLCLAGYDLRIMSLFALAVLAVMILPVVFHRKLKEKLGGAYFVLKLIFTILTILYIISVVIFWCYIGLDARRNAESYAIAAESFHDDGSGTVVVVFGCHTDGYTPGPTLKLRLDEAFELLDALPEAVCVVSGGQGSNETVAEAESMKAYLMNRGIDGSRIYAEDESHSTSENIRFTKELLEENSITPTRIIGVSTAFHLPRIEILSHVYSLPMEVCAAKSPDKYSYYVSMVREYLSFIKLVAVDVIINQIFG